MTKPPSPVTSTSKAAARIRAAAVDAFATNGYGGTTTREIAARLDMSPAAMYPHYRSKEDLLFAISYDGHATTREVISAADLPGEPPTARLRSMIAAFARWQADHHAQARVVQYELTALTPEHYRDVVAIRREITQHFRQVVEAGAAAGEFTVPDAEGVTLALMSLCVDVCRWFPAGAYTDADAVASLYADLAMRLVGAD
ncbi:TetR/AcrR family transcriptional regulator [Rhodococcus triatomae]|uniref:DNA-binding transcriptional regulator, AcrR family n=1 Tax=Rhodococcus triatomae TaxID=300028 RepID=A0A1G8GB05_9NOCA|nr:TetR/AcrR family transcriptional regulator [Rhodococcus triatomae]QNG20437.1 TetR/AcrR family transcriptional regulator [Rhodococcus triatomae]QNG23647.1 TetR/AcrR family transcriptional regulator [Rhodococcus triatomae]SDH91592.1 DNA-binding transcriptional regulator, AcrR family [Rhodococcus triatomae]